ncbi:MAG: HK97 family phage prohead protease, partial [Bacteroidota bacterium]
MSKIERRTYQTGEVRAAKEADSRTIEGYAALFGSKSQNLGGFREIIQDGAFDEVLQDDVRALFNHKNDHVLARTKSGTLSLSVDSTGLRYSFEAPDTTLGNDLLEMIRRGDISQSSFGFTIDEDKW